MLNPKILLAFFVTVQSTIAVSALAISPQRISSEFTSSTNAINMRVTDISDTTVNRDEYTRQTLVANRGQDYDSNKKEYDSNNKSKRGNNSQKGYDYDR
ncbi:hypothetical protein GM3708_3068 [Geminocystis sp. NIES-3708]|uniref:hypothetical protein n=1 Tax=Geminocystis sp. NIES-3708 TaxID=1615909 RepID=UPI0005FC509A|nr:hypothetical protein [Geminocystis sp. NIES-3708]BAQ62662.1 hypothetical protein GM3708_3068 [Geminocystis sp. NIES-3708]